MSPVMHLVQKADLKFNSGSVKTGGIKNIWFDSVWPCGQLLPGYTVKFKQNLTKSPHGLHYLTLSDLLELPTFLFRQHTICFPEQLQNPGLSHTWDWKHFSHDNWSLLEFSGHQGVPWGIQENVKLQANTNRGAQGGLVLLKHSQH
jgi:hypothetical protein